MRHFTTLVLLFLAADSFAQLSTRTPPVRAAGPAAVTETWGTASVSKLQIAGASLIPLDGGTKLESDGYFWAEPYGSRLAGGVALPSGARIEGVDLYYDDTDAANDIRLTLFSMSGTTSLTLGAVSSVFSTGSSGKNVASGPPAAVTVTNADTQYMLYVYNSAADKAVRAVAVRYVLQVSPGPTTATFADVPASHPFFRFVEAMARAGITGGCTTTPPQFCPDAAVTRGQMAVFLSTALGLHWTP